MDTKTQHKALGIYIATGTGLSTCLGLILATVYQDLLPFIGVFIGIGATLGVAMGIGYVAFGRNLWPLIIAHCALNSLSMLGNMRISP